MAEAVDQWMASVMRRKWTMLTLRRLEAMREALGEKLAGAIEKKTPLGAVDFALRRWASKFTEFLTLCERQKSSPAVARPSRAAKVCSCTTRPCLNVLRLQ
jgi:hypothetical protein